MIQDAAPAPRPRRAIEDPDEFYTEAGSTATPLVGAGRWLRRGIAASAVTAVAALTFVVPGLAQATGAGGFTAANPTSAAPGTVGSFDTRATSVDRSSTREALTQDDVASAADARAAVLSAQGAQVATTQQELALANRTSGLDTANSKIKAESDRLLSLRFLKPTDGEITSEWGMRFHPILHYVRMHAGVDMGGSCGQPIWAARDGVVVSVGSGGQSGNEVRIDHGDEGGAKIETAYLHMDRMDVKVGQKVTRGAQIGTVGNTGLSTSCHLHFAVYTNGENVNPRTYLDA